MLRIERPRREVDKDALFARRATDTEDAELISGPCELWSDGVLVAACLRVEPSELAALRRAADGIPYSGSKRIDGGIVQRSTTFGNAARNPFRFTPCMRAKSSITNPIQHATLLRYSRHADVAYKALVPDVYEAHRKNVEGVLPCWRMTDSVFTSGICNENSPLAHHRDFGNFDGAWSVMYTFKDGIEGGDLHLPEYGVVLELADCSMLLFNGQKIIHGVTPIRLRYPLAKRHTIVYYALAQMRHCLEPNEELVRIRAGRDALEHRRGIDGDEQTKIVKDRLAMALYTYQVAIVTHRRAELFAEQTSGLLRHMRDRVTLFLSDEEDQKAYAPLGYNAVVTGAKNLTEKLNFLHNHYEPGTRVVVLEDDVAFVTPNTIGKNGTKPYTDLDALCQRGFSAVRDGGLWGVAPHANAFYMSGKTTRTLKLVVGYCFGFVATRDPELLLHCETKTDYERTLRYFVKYGFVVRLDDVGVATVNYTQPGGLATHMNHEARTGAEQRACDYLVKKWPHLVEHNTKKASLYAELKLKRCSMPVGELQEAQRIADAKSKLP